MTKPTDEEHLARVWKAFRKIAIRIEPHHGIIGLLTYKSGGGVLTVAWHETQPAWFPTTESATSWKTLAEAAYRLESLAILVCDKIPKRERLKKS